VIAQPWRTIVGAVQPLSKLASNWSASIGSIALHRRHDPCRNGGAREHAQKENYSCDCNTERSVNVAINGKRFLRARADDEISHLCPQPQISEVGRFEVVCLL
jgi:hypothetical protein